ncbi:MAG: hypothetical protein H6Q04_1959 [Acidobacteria bacterium]|nr:hypothetical protein [Acidobacteriota bacterium]
MSGSNSAVECQLPKLDVAGSIPVSRSSLRQGFGWLARRSFSEGGLNPIPYSKSHPRQSPIESIRLPEPFPGHLQLPSGG